MKKKIIIVVVIILIICLFPMKKLYSDIPITTYNAILYKYIKYDNNSIYNFPSKNKLIVFPMNFKDTLKYYNAEIQELHMCNSNHDCVELLLGEYNWNKKTNDAIYPIARSYKEILPVNNNEEIIFCWSTNVEIESVVLYDAKTTNVIKDSVDFKKYSITLHDLDKGEYIISIHTKNNTNKVEYSFKVKIED